MIFFGLVLRDSAFNFGEDSGFPLIEGDNFVEFVALFRKKREILLVNGLDEAHTELMLSGVFEGGIVVHVLFEGLAGTHNIVICQVQKNTFELKFLCTGRSQLVT
jgi:hypothetical protein